MSTFNSISYLPIPIYNVGVISWLSYNKDSGSIFCSLCHSAIWFNALKGHLADIHRLPPLHRRPAINYFKTIQAGEFDLRLDNNHVARYMRLIKITNSRP